jgi:predicted aspartyl protease
MTPTASVQVSGTRGSVLVTGVLDTGFDGHLCLPINLAVTLGLLLEGEDQVELADGSLSQELVFGGNVVFMGLHRRVDIYLTRSEEALIGTALLDGCRLMIDFATGKVKLTESSRGK